MCLQPSSNGQTPIPIPTPAPHSKAGEVNPDPHCQSFLTSVYSLESFPVSALLFTKQLDHWWPLEGLLDQPAQETRPPGLLLPFWLSSANRIP